MRAFVLSGDGAKSAYQAGILKKLEELEIKPDIILGSSSGAISSALYSVGGSYLLEKLWTHDINNILDVFGFNWDFFRKQGLFNTRPLRKRLEKIFSTFSTPTIDFQINRLEMESNFVRRHRYKAYDNISIDLLVEQIEGAVAIQGIVEPVNGFADAGARELVPVAQAIELGATEIYVILATPPYYIPYEIPKGFGAFAKIMADSIEFLINRNFVNDLLDIHRHNMCQPSKKIAVRIFGPKDRIGHTLSFNRGKQYFNMGYHSHYEFKPTDIFPSEFL